jgi:hypothetical protein
MSRQKAKVEDDEKKKTREGKFAPFVDLCRKNLQLNESYFSKDHLQHRHRCSELLRWVFVF